MVPELSRTEAAQLKLITERGVRSRRVRRDSDRRITGERILEALKNVLLLAGRPRRRREPLLRGSGNRTPLVRRRWGCPEPARYCSGRFPGEGALTGPFGPSDGCGNRERGHHSDSGHRLAHLSSLQCSPWGDHRAARRRLARPQVPARGRGPGGVLCCFLHRRGAPRPAAVKNRVALELALSATQMPRDRRVALQPAHTAARMPLEPCDLTGTPCAARATFPPRAPVEAVKC